MWVIGVGGRAYNLSPEISSWKVFAKHSGNFEDGLWQIFANIAGLVFKMACRKLFKMKRRLEKFSNLGIFKPWRVKLLRALPPQGGWGLRVLTPPLRGKLSLGGVPRNGGGANLRLSSLSPCGGRPLKILQSTN